MAGSSGAPSTYALQNRLKGHFIWTIVEFAGPLTRDVLQAAVRVTVLRHPILRCRIERRRFVVTPFEQFVAEHPNLVDEAPDADPQQLAGKRPTPVSDVPEEVEGPQGNPCVHVSPEELLEEGVPEARGKEVRAPLG